MSKTKMLNKTVTTTLILLLTLSILNIINFIAIPRASASPGVNITEPTAGIAVNTTGFLRAGKAFQAATYPLLAAVDNATTAPYALNVTVMEAGNYNQTQLNVDVASVYLKSSVGTGAIINCTSGHAVEITADDVIVDGFTMQGPTFVVELLTAIDNVTIRNNVINTTGVASIGISMHGLYTNLVIQNNTFYLDMISADGDVGINFNPDDTIQMATEVTITQNIFVDTTTGAQAMSFAGLHDASITSNTMNMTNVELILEKTLDTDNVTFASNTWNGNKTQSGIKIAVNYANTTDRQLKNLNVTGNTFRNLEQYGVIFKAGDADLNGHDLQNSTIYIYYNNFEDITGYNGVGYRKGAVNATFTSGPVTINATYNWWGHTTGPSSVANGYGEVVSTNVLYDPWLSAPYPSTTVFAGIWLKPTRASAGSTIDVFSSDGDFTGGETVRTYFDASIVNTTTAATNGSLYANFTVPSISAGAYTVTSAGGTNSYLATFTIPTLSITITPTWGPPGQTVSVTGEGFTRSGLVRIYLDGTYMNSTMADDYGNVTKTFTVPSTTVPGTYTVKANDWSTTTNATQTLTVPTHTLTTITPIAGPPGIEVAVIGGNFTVSGFVGIYFDTTFAGNLTANTDGAITTGHVHVPSLVPGAYAVKGKDWNTGMYTASTLFTVSTPNITRTPTWGPPGTPVTVSGGNFTVSNGTKIYFESTSVANTTTNATGGIDTANTFNVPFVVPGTYTLRVMDNYTAHNVTTTFIVPIPTLTLTQDGGPPGTLVTVSGGNFTVSNVTRIYFDAISMINVTTEADGSIPALTTFTVPANTTIGAHTVRAFDVATTYNKTATFTAGPVIWIGTVAGTPLANVTVTGSGFAINQTAGIYFDTTFIQNAAVNASGGLNTWFLIPDAVAGAHNISAYDVNTTIWTPAQTFTISQPTIAIADPAQGQVGELKVVTGTLFKLNATVNIYFGSTLVRTVNATSVGALPDSTNFTVPSVVPALYTVNASDGVNYATATFNVMGTGGIDTLQSMVAEIEAKLDQYGSFWNFTNTWFTTISNKLGVFTGNDTVASLLYDIKTSVIAINFTSIDNKLGTFTGTDTVASLLYDIKTSVSAINWTDITAIKAKTDTINWADIASIKGNATLSIDYLWGLQDHPLWGLRTVIVPMLESIKNATQFTAGTYNTILPNSTAPVNLGKSSKVTLTVRATDDATEGFVIKVYIYDGTAWRPLSFSVPGIASVDCAATVEFTTGADGRLYFETTGATFTAFTYSAEFAP
jgi:hypothetical protein